MKKKQIFYDYLINTEEITLTLEGDCLDELEKEELIGLIDQTLHQQTLEVILDHLPKEFHEDFLKMFSENPYNPHLLTFIKEKVTIDIEKVISEKASKTKKEMLFDIKKSKKK